jgi:toxin CcdB
MQFTVYPMLGARPGYIVDVQSGLLENLATRVVIPLLPKSAAPRIPLKTLNPFLLFNGYDFVLMTQNMASIRVAQLGHAVGTLATQRDQIVRAIDALLSGI